ncbi:MAG: GatB/YqeY domain-containing protein [Patescibacteria group bacterium]|nr:GatB/YqeY domain-containing protein [Patescibacteria group bacterium]
MSLKSQIKDELITAMKAKDEFQTSILRMLSSALKNKEIDLGHELTDEEVLSVIKTMLKQGKDAVADFKAGDREDLVAKQEKENEFLERFMPEQMPDTEIEKLAKESIQELNASTPADMGKVMGAVMKKAGGMADGNRVREIVQKLLV